MTEFKIGDVIIEIGDDKLVFVLKTDRYYYYVGRVIEPNDLNCETWDFCITKELAHKNYVKIGERKYTEVVV